MAAGTVPLGNEITVPSAALTQAGLCVCVCGDKFICHISQPFTVRGEKKPRGRADPVSVGLCLWVLCLCPSSNPTPTQPCHQGSCDTAKTSHFQPKKSHFQPKKSHFQLWQRHALSCLPLQLVNTPCQLNPAEATAALQLQ